MARPTHTFVLSTCGYRLYIDGDTVGLNVANTHDPRPWYNLGKWEDFKREVDSRIEDLRIAKLCEYSDDQLRAELARRGR